MVSFLRSATWRLIFLGKAIKETTKGLYAWYKQDTSQASRLEVESLSREPKSKNSWSRTLRGTSVLITRSDGWYELEAYGPIQRIVIICSSLRTALEKMVETLDRQCEQYQAEQRGPEWWDSEEEDFVVETEKTRH
jgi:hypothetical protein